MKSCKYCGCEFEPIVAVAVLRQEFCKEGCRRSWWAHKVPRAVHLASVTFIKFCERCGHRFEFDPKTNIAYWNRRRFCTSSCGKAARELRRAARIGNYNFAEYRRLHHQLVHVEGLPCSTCGCDDKSVLQVDHIKPRFLGGTNERVNLQVLCVLCHRSKTRCDVRGYAGPLVYAS